MDLWTHRFSKNSKEPVLTHDHHGSKNKSQRTGQRTYPDPSILCQFFHKTTCCRLFEKFQKNPETGGCNLVTPENCPTLVLIMGVGMLHKTHGSHGLHRHSMYPMEQAQSEPVPPGNHWAHSSKMPFCLVVLDSTRACSKAQSVLWFTALPCPPPPPLVGRTSGTGSTKSGTSTRWLPAHLGKKPQKAPEHDTKTGYILWNEPIGPVPPGQVIILSSWMTMGSIRFCSKR